MHQKGAMIKRVGTLQMEKQRFKFTCFNLNKYML